MQGLVSTVNELRAYPHEQEWFEFKGSWYDPNGIGEYISALANAAALAGRDVGYLVWGIEDASHELVGTDFDPDRSVRGEPLKHFLARQLEPDAGFAFGEVEVEGVRLVVLTVRHARVAPVGFAGERFIRIGSSKERLRKFPETEAALFSVLAHGAPTVVNTPSQYQDPSFEQLFMYYGAKGLRLSEATFEKNLSLRTADGRYNVLAQLLSDDSHMPLRVAIFSGASKADNMYSVREFGNQCLLYSLDAVLRYGDVLNIIQSDEANRVVERREVPLFEDGAFREAVVNAFLHNWWVGGNEPMITVYSDRIEILSRGTLAPGQTLEGFFAGESVPVNAKLSEIFLQLRISEKTGRGVPRITASYGREAFEFRENSIVVRVPFNWINVMGNTASASRTPSRGANALNETQTRVLSEMRNNPNITKPQLAAVVGRSETTVDNCIAALKRAGCIRRMGSNKNGYWDVLV